MSRLFLPAAALLAWVTGAAVSYGSFRSAFPPPSEIRVPLQGAAGDMFALAFGARRLFADIWFIRLLQYYGAPELVEQEGGKTEIDEEAEEGGTGKYPEFVPRSLHILQLDSGFHAACLYSAAALAFNMERPDDAESVLDYGLKYSPKEWKYLIVKAAIGYSKTKDPENVALSIAPMLKDPDCPVMLKQVAAFLNKKAGNYAAAAAIYADILATSHDPAYLRNAERQLAKLTGRGKPRRI